MHSPGTGSGIVFFAMGLLARNQPDTNPVVNRLLEESRARRAEGLKGRERVAVVGAAIAFICFAIPFAVLAPDDRSFDLAIAAALVGLYVLATRIEFHSGSGWTDASQMVFVPMLFLLPIGLVPLLAAGAVLLSKLPEYLRGDERVERSLVLLATSWYTVGPALVFAIAGAGDPTWSDWPIYLAALGAQFGFDLASSLVTECWGTGLSVREDLKENAEIYWVDALFSPIGLVLAMVSVQHEWAFLAVLPLLGVLKIFAREREGRIENALALSSAYRGTAYLLGELLSGTHEYTGAHSRTVVVLSQRVAAALGFDERELRDVEFGALLHDVGKISIPNSMLDKPGPLTDSEWAVMKQHTIEGERMLEQLGGWLVGVAGIVRSHHEHWDGRGYPDGLIGEEIPKASRVIAACDAFNAMTTDRSYRTAMSREAAIEELRACSGTQFDPGVVDVLVAIVKSDESIGAGLTPRGPVMTRHAEATRALRSQTD